jgi:hypothetical protein
MERTEKSHRRTTALWGVLAVAALVVPALAATAAASAPAPQPNAPPVQWAYGGSRWVNVTTDFANSQYEAHAFFGWTVIFTLTNTSNSTFEIEAQRTLGATYTAQYCSPTCATPKGSLSLVATGVERETGFANFTVNGTVDESGASVPALGLENSHAVGAASLNETVVGTRTVLGTTRAASANLDVKASAATQVNFATPLGIAPWNLSAGTSWNSSSAFTASGTWAIAYNWSVSGAYNNNTTAISGSGSPSGQVNSSGTVGLYGVDLGTYTLANGQNTSVVALTWGVGPFDGVDGIILVPRAYEIFGGGAHVFAGHAPGVESIATSHLDLVLVRNHHVVRFAAATTNYAGSDSLAAVGTSSSVNAQASTPALAGPSGPAASGVQAQPESVPQAQAAAACLVASGCTASAPGGSAGPAGLRPLTFVAVGVVVVAVVATVGYAAYASRGRRRGPGGSLNRGDAVPVPSPYAQGGFTPPLAPPSGNGPEGPGARP